VDYDVLVVGAGIAGEEASLSLGQMGYKVLLVEKGPSIGGKMVLLSKTFPTLDCASCISTPKMAETYHHPNITLMTYAEVKEITRKGDGSFKARLLQKPRYINEAACTACQQCEMSCPVMVTDEFNFGLTVRKAAYIPFSTAIPNKAVIDVDNCILCGACEKVCPAGCIDFTQMPQEVEFTVGSVIVSTGFELCDAEKKPAYGYGRYKNVITAMQMERLLAPTRPYNTVLRPSDGRVPDNIAYVLCAGSRDNTVENPICSRVCCMYSLKQAQLLMGVLPLADITIYYMDIRAFGKGYEEFYQQTKAMGTNLVKGRVGKIDEKENGNLILHYEDIDNGAVKKQAEHDLVVLAVGFLPNNEITKVFKEDRLLLDDSHFIKEIDEDMHPGKTSIDGVFVAGTSSGPMDIPDTIIHAATAAGHAAVHAENIKKGSR
jgi:heterodisulfide reductase subunit A